MERCCKVCNQVKKTPYKDICRSCYQKKWGQSIPEKICQACNKPFKTVGASCRTCYSNARNKATRSTECSCCKRSGLIIRNIPLSLCIKCNRQKLENEKPILKVKRQDYLRNYSRKKKGTDLNAPIRRPLGKWKTQGGYIMIFRPNHPNADVNGCVREHCFVLSEHIGRPLKKNESVHHINGLRDDNRIENLELWHRGQCPGQRLEEKIAWAKKFLEDYGFHVN